MQIKLPLGLRRALYATRGGFLVRPFAIAITLGFTGMTISSLEERYPYLDGWAPRALALSRADPQVAQAILSDIATSIMTVVSIVFAILLMTLTLASMQFSPRILLSFVRDRVTQWTLGVFLGTFSYCMAALPAVHFAPTPASPIAAVLGAMALALVCVGWLLFFIHHISHAISVNHIVDRIAGDTEDVIDQIAPHPRTAMESVTQPRDERRIEEQGILSIDSGYLRYIDVGSLVSIATTLKIRARIGRRVGQFVPAGTVLFFASPSGRLGPADLDQLRSAFDIGPARTLQQDVEFGVLQIVDIALRAISPAVNDPSTAIGCIDQLSRLMIRWVSRNPPQTIYSSPPHVVRVIMPWISHGELLQTAFAQIRHYSSSDAAVSLRLLRALEDIATTVDDPEARMTLTLHGRRVVEGCRDKLNREDVDALNVRLASLMSRAGIEADHWPRG